MKITGFARKYTGYICLIFGFVLLKAIFTFIAPVIIKKILDQISSGSINPDGIQTYFILFAVTFFLLYAVNFILSYFNLKFSFVFKVNELENLYQKLMRIRYADYYKNGTAYYVNRITVFVYDLFSLLSNTLSYAFISILTILISFYFIYKINIGILWISFILLPLNYFGFKLINKSLLKKSQNMQHATAANYEKVTNTIANFELIKQLVDYPAITALMRRFFTASEEAQNEVNFYAQNISLLLIFVIDGIKNLILFYSIYLLSQKALTFSDVIFLNMIMSIYSGALSELNKININLRDLKVNFNFLRDEFAQKTENSGTLELAPVENIRFDINEFNYESKRVLNDFRLSFSKGRSYAVVGGSGCGKSTVAKLLVGLYNSNIYINDVGIENYNLESLRNRIYLVSHTPQIFPCSIEENIKIGCTDNELRNYEKLMQLPFVKVLAEKYDFSKTNILESGVNISSGEKQSISMMRMLIRNPEVIVLDEATSAMDSKWEEMAIKDMGHYLGTGKILINISHRLSSIKSCGEIVLLENGHIRHIGSLQDMLGNSLFKKIFSSQIDNIQTAPGN
ncbi:MAG: hypothetical protein A2270_07475 [Elusimicrobia bacterium RIFOXYA12_FULL_51_18]|nr:MAG: hypothetical protein A2270_07475 [Elusimicrobia bacterium RIFOXYA12_FULL_51_18]OGS28522.1 MAG: hypothetical protein A2218_05780 [Elusimicrobia bacterium RIFOXYA2_FULL_53_38]